MVPMRELLVSQADLAWTGRDRVGIREPSLTRALGGDSRRWRMVQAIGGFSRVPPAIAIGADRADGCLATGRAAPSVECFLVDDVFANRLAVERTQDVLG